MRTLLVLILLAACGGPSRPRIERADQLPPHRYPVTGELGRLVVDQDAFAALARPLRADLESDLARFDIREPESLKDRLFVVALLDALDNRWPDALARIEQVAAVETRPAEKVMTGLTIRVWADALTHGGDPDAFRAALERKLAAMPIDLIRSQLSILRTMGQVFTPDTCRELVNRQLAPRVVGGALSFDQAAAIAFQRYAVVRLAPVGAAIDQVLAARGIEPQKDD